MRIPELYVCGLVAYDGTDYRGFQYQPGVPTIQGTLEDALSRVAHVTSRVVGSGRTDTGVHASGQVISVHVRWRHDLGSLTQAWNANLPASICVLRLALAPDTFQPRFSALWRTYRYRVYQFEGPHDAVVPRRSPLTDRFLAYESRTLDVDRMEEAAKTLIGEHDFTTFGLPTAGTSTVRYVQEAGWQEIEQSVPDITAYSGRRLVFTVTANGFLRQMVRKLVGMLVAVGRGDRAPCDVVAALQAKDRRYALPPAPPCGLVLERVIYPDALDVLSCRR